MVVSFKERLSASKIIPVVRHHDHDIALQACVLLVEEGLSVLELTTTIPGFAELIAQMRSRFPEIEIGAGTVLTQRDAELALKAGAGFLVSPCWSGQVSETAREAGKPYLPGAMTPGEVLHHASAGASIVKVFPANSAGGPGFLKALTSVFPNIPLMPTGGVTPENTQSYLEAGAVCVGMGGNLLPFGALVAGKTEQARNQINAALKAASFHTF